MKNKIFFILFLFIWIIIVISNFVAPKQTFSEQENKMLSRIPNFYFEDFVSGKYLQGVDDYINDHFIARNEFLKLNSWWEVTVMGKKENNNVYIGKDGYLFEKFDYGTEEEKNLKIATESINKYAQNVDIPTYFILIPNSIYINSEKLPANVQIANQKKIIEGVYQNTVTQNVEATTLLEKNKKLNLYFKTDHHLTSEGAYLVYIEYCKTAGITPEPIQNFKREVVSKDFLGTFDSKAQIVNQKMDEIAIYKNSKNTNLEEVIYDNSTSNSIYNEEYLGKKDKYSYFLNGNNSKVVVKTKVKNGKKLLVIKDSYAHIFAQFLTQNYEEIHFIDPRYYNLEISNYAKENGVTESLILYNVSNLVKDIGIRNLR